MKYQRILSILFSIGFLTFSYAQKINNFGVQFSPGTAFQSRRTENSSQISVRPQLGFKTGFVYQYKFSKYFNVETNLSYTLLRNKTVSKMQEANVKYKFGLYYSGAQLSMLFQYQIPSKRNLDFIYTVGTSINYMAKRNFYFEDLVYRNEIEIKRNWNYQMNSGFGFIKNETKTYYGLQLDLGLFISFSESVQIEDQFNHFWIKSSSAFFVIKHYLN